MTAIEVITKVRDELGAALTQLRRPEVMEAQQRATEREKEATAAREEAYATWKAFLLAIIRDFELGIFSAPKLAELSWTLKPQEDAARREVEQRLQRAVQEERKAKAEKERIEAPFHEVEMLHLISECMLRSAIEKATACSAASDCASAEADIQSDDAK